MDKVEVIVKVIIPVLTTIVAPFVMKWMDSKHDRRKFNNEQLTVNFESAKEFESIQSGTVSNLVKDRISKKTFNNESLSFEQADYFSQFYDMDYWVVRYLKVLKKLNAVRDENNIIIGFKVNFKKSARRSAFIEYLVFALLFALPFCFVDFYKTLIFRSIQEQVYYVTAILITYPFLFLIGAIASLKKGGDINEANKFVSDLNQLAIKGKYPLRS